ncbi:calsyntenin-2 [Cricetulus griseus]|nr:calsyntenin-2 [Cricetulus griseus]
MASSEFWEICAFKIHGQELPFEAVVLNKTSGEGRLRAKSPIDCELQKEYTFIIQAYDCGVGPREAAWKKSHKAVVHIQVKDVNEFAPTFKEPAYKAIVTEGKIYDSILQVEAIDEDCSPQYSQICNYEIVTTDVPFAIDRNGCRYLFACHQLFSLSPQKLWNLGHDKHMVNSKSGDICDEWPSSTWPPGSCFQEQGKDEMQILSSEGKLPQS